MTNKWYEEYGIKEYYYVDDSVCIIHDDSREILPKLKGTVITDPPYNIDYHYRGYKDKLTNDDYHNLLSVCCRTPSVVIHYVESLFELSWMLEEIPVKVVAWVYPSNTLRQWRGIAWYGTPAPDISSLKQPYRNQNDKRIRKLMSDGKQARSYDWWEVNQVKNVSREKTEHPCQVPETVMERIIKITPCNTIIDPFLGSGTTATASKRLGHKCIGIEIEEKYCEIAALRCLLTETEVSG